MAFLLIYMWIVHNIDTKSISSQKEKEWVVQSFAYLSAFFIIVWATKFAAHIMVICFYSLSSDIRLIILFMRIFFSGTVQLISHFIDGFQLNQELPIEERLYDSKFIHITRLGLLFFIPFFMSFVLVSGCCLFILAEGRDHMSNVDFANRCRSIPYGRLMFEEGKECPICLSSFTTNDDVVQLQCHNTHVFHFACLRDHLAHGSRRCPMCRAAINLDA